MDEPRPALLVVREVADELRLTRADVRALIDEGSLPTLAYAATGAPLIPVSVLDAYREGRILPRRAA